MRTLTRWLAILFVLGVAGGTWFALYGFRLGALDDPWRLETYLARNAKRWYVRRSARGPLPNAPPKDRVSVTVGGMAFRGDCANCHGIDGRTPTEIGRWMYPRVLDLGSPEVQQWSDAELFWIIKNGIRLSGMPGFGKTRSDEQIWYVVHYVRSLGAQPAR